MNFTPFKKESLSIVQKIDLRKPYLLNDADIFRFIMRGSILFCAHPPPGTGGYSTQGFGAGCGDSTWEFLPRGMGTSKIIYFPKIYTFIILNHYFCNLNALTRFSFYKQLSFGFSTSVA